MKKAFKNISLLLAGGVITVLLLTILPLKHCGYCGEMYNSLTYKGTTKGECAICYGWKEYESRKK